MWWIQYVLLFCASALLSVGAFTGYGRGFTSLLGMFAWFIVGNASSAVVYYDGAGTQHVAQSVPLTWLCYGVAVVHLVVFLITLHEIVTGDDTENTTPDELADQLRDDPTQSDNFDIPQ